MTVVTGLGDVGGFAAHVATALVVGGAVFSGAYPTAIDVEAAKAPAAGVTDPVGIVSHKARVEGRTQAWQQFFAAFAQPATQTAALFELTKQPGKE